MGFDAAGASSCLADVPRVATRTQGILGLFSRRFRERSESQVCRFRPNRTLHRFDRRELLLLLGEAVSHTARSSQDNLRFGIDTGSAGHSTTWARIQIAQGLRAWTDKV